MQHNEFDLPLNRAPGRQYSRGRKRNREDGEGNYILINLYSTELIFNQIFPDDEGGEEDQDEQHSEAASETEEA